MTKAVLLAALLLGPQMGGIPATIYEPSRPSATTAWGNDATFKAPLPDRERDRMKLAYWGNTRTGNAVLKVNYPNAGADARAQVTRIGGDGWVPLWIGDEPGYGAAQCLSRMTPTGKRVLFFVAHGHASPMEAYKTARAKAEEANRTLKGEGPFGCSYPTWHVSGVIGSATKQEVLDGVKGQVRKLVGCQSEPSAEATLAPIGNGVARPKAKPGTAGPKPAAKPCKIQKQPNTTDARRG